MNQIQTEMSRTTMRLAQFTVAVLFLLMSGGMAHGQLQALIDATPAGGSIVLPEGQSYTESITISKAISINGSGAELDASGQPFGISIASNVDGVTIEDFEIVGDSVTTSGITVNPGASNVTIRDNDISGMGMSNSNGSPLSYGVLCWGNTDPVNPPMDILIDDNDIHGVSGTAISLGDNTEGVTISNNHFYDIQQVLVNGTLTSFGVVAGKANYLAISGNEMYSLDVATSLTSCTNVSMDSNQYTGGTSLMLLASLPNSILPDAEQWWSIEAALWGYISFFNSSAAQEEVNVFLLDQEIPTTLSSSHPGCMDSEACNYDADAISDDGSCGDDVDGDGICNSEDNCSDTEACNYADPLAMSCLNEDECGVCGGDGILDGDCDCDGNQLDALGDCGGDCLMDIDADGVCDTEDNCTDTTACNYNNYSNAICLQVDTCGVCGGAGAVFDCGCADIPEEDCDCDGNQLDALEVCGGDCAADADSDGICDDEDDCVGALDSCGVCNGPGAIYYCGCADIPEGDCDCDGSQLDALEVCGGDCAADADDDGVCDDVDPCVGALDSCGVCNGPGAIYDCGCAGIPEGDCDCDGNQFDAIGICDGDCAADVNEDGICDDGQLEGCMDPFALNYDEDAVLSGTCNYAPDYCAPVFEQDLQDTVFVACLDDLPMEIPVVTAINPCAEGSVPVLSTLEGVDTTTACGQFITFQHVALNLSQGLLSVAVETYAVRDTAGPEIVSMPPMTVFGCPAEESETGLYGDATAVDACHDLAGIEYSIDSTWVDSTQVICAGNSMLLRTVRATDICGNATTQSYEVTIKDTIPPTFGAVPQATTLSCEEALPTELPLVGDLCSGDTLILDTLIVPGDCPAEFTVHRIFKAIDGCGNQASRTQHVHFIDTLAPVILTAPSSLLLSCEQQVPDSAITADDNCSSLTIAFADSLEQGDCPQEYTLHRLHTAEDACGNAASTVQIIQVVDTVAPHFTSLDPFVSASCADHELVMAAADDTCSNVSITFTAFSAVGSGTPGQQIRIVTAADDCGNSVEGLQLLTFDNAAECSGCTDAAADNYDPAALVEDGSCDYGGIYNQSGACNHDADQDGICDELEIVGCTDSTACNFIDNATDEGACLFPSNPLLDCSGACLNDADNDGVCDEDEVEGCMEEDACNYYAFATNAGACDYSCQGCTYSSAENYAVSATSDDGSCEFDFSAPEEPVCDGDADGDGQVGIHDLLSVLEEYGSDCD